MRRYACHLGVGGSGLDSLDLQEKLGRSAGAFGNPGGFPPRRCKFQLTPMGQSSFHLSDGADRLTESRRVASESRVENQIDGKCQIYTTMDPMNDSARCAYVRRLMAGGG